MFILIFMSINSINLIIENNWMLYHHQVLYHYVNEFHSIDYQKQLKIMSFRNRNDHHAVLPVKPKWIDLIQSIHFDDDIDDDDVDDDDVDGVVSHPHHPHPLIMHGIIFVR